MPTLWTIGHSTLDAATFIARMRDAGLEAIADVRRYPASRRHPQFAAAALAHALSEAGIDYHPMPDLGGRREPHADSINTAWKQPAFRGYADYMQTGAFIRARDRLAAIASRRPTAMLCAEADWHDCHRSLIADAFKADGWEVVHLRGSGQSETHPYTHAARIVDGRLVYSLPEPPQGSLF